MQVAATADRDGASLSLRFPDGSVAGRLVELGAPVETNFYGRPVAGRLVRGAFAESLRQLAGRPLRLVRVDEPGAGSDRGVDGTRLRRVARLARGVRARGRRGEASMAAASGCCSGSTESRRTARTRWAGRRVAIGGAVVRIHGLVGRCAVTSQNPNTGVPDLGTLRVIRRYRSEIETDEPLPFGVWGGVEAPGLIRIGDAVEAL